jgi:hypothetical protein
MTTAKVLQFQYVTLISSQEKSNYQVLSHSEFSPIIYAAICALPHVSNSCLREELKHALCDLLLRQNGAA